MTIDPTDTRGWCAMSDCPTGQSPQDCVVIGEVTVCKPCLVVLGDGVPRSDLETVEREVDTLGAKIEILEEEAQTPNDG